MILSVSTLNFYRKFGSDVNKILDNIRNGDYDLDGVELNVFSIALKDTELTNKNIEYLGGLKFNTIHGNSDMYDDNVDVFSKKLNELYQQANAQYIVFHPGQFNINKLKEYFKGCKICVENLISRDNEKMRSRIKNIIKQKGIDGFCLDIAHAESPEEVKLYIKEFRESIYGVHVSENEFGEKLTHNLFSKSSIKDIGKLRKVIELGKPLIMEGVMETWSDLKKEIEFIRSYQ